MAESGARFSFTEVVDILAKTPGRLAAATAGATADALHEPLEPGGWSARDILGHLRACDMTWGGYLERILAQDRPTFRYRSPRSTIRRTDFLDVPFGASLEVFTADRARFVSRLGALDSHDLARAAMVEVSGGRVQEHTAASYAERIAEHELEHVRHIEGAFASRP